jgi:hypothetical protein
MFNIFDPHTSKARYEQKVVLLHLWRVRVKTRSRIASGPKSYGSTETLVLYTHFMLQSICQRKVIVELAAVRHCLSISQDLIWRDICL